ncbi:MAG: hypothetical protein ACKVUS_18365 [Saprospiraceae bacterium]
MTTASDSPNHSSLEGTSNLAADRWAEMEFVQSDLYKEFVWFCQKFCAPAVPLNYFNIPYTRFEKDPPLRGYFPIVFQSYIQGEGGRVNLSNHFMNIQLPFILELLISVLYYDNQIFDKKYGVVDNATISENLVRRNRLYDGLLRYARKNIKDKEISDELTDLIQEMHEMVSMGQEWERKYNHYDSWKSPKPMDAEAYFKLSGRKIDLALVRDVRKVVESAHPIPMGQNQFLDAYLSRIYLTNASLFSKTAEFVLRHTNLQEEAKENLLHFSGVFGMLLQIVNDNADFVPASEGLTTSAKMSNDALSDLRNQNITLPIALHLIRSGDGGQVAVFLKSGGDPAVCLEDEVYSKELAASYAIYYSMRIGKDLEKDALALLSRENPAYENFKNMTGVAGNNRFYRYFYDLKEDEDGKKGSYYKRYKKSKKSPPHDSIG